jgi:hypothetical protein
VIRQPHILECVQVALAYALKQAVDVERPQLDVLVADLVLEEDIRQVRDPKLSS